jgi:hypothetical protein
MAIKKDYYCKDCGHNNNGWCPKKKKNGLKDITAKDCNEKTLEKNIDGIEIEIEVEDDILSKANKEMACTKQSLCDDIDKVNDVAQSLKNKEMLDFLKEHLRLDSDTRSGLIPGSKIVTVTLMIDDEPISDIDFLTR